MTSNSAHDSGPTVTDNLGSAVELSDLGPSVTAARPIASGSNSTFPISNYTVNRIRSRTRW
eukprot:CAMPEP_0184680504 /NCGR_PEP_ID=MMETSP0312-20130426/3391_1 /TAXON_ID=31354 /ORGANISM="Compsopogon coeruleus, Strain SAG 36.94" /LENGTH=60 /DNA_ID=CAMNT_0027130657 /DNA_START=305 /DNA_END=484 /DNA_ORIENTATION=-